MKEIITVIQEFGKLPSCQNSLLLLYQRCATHSNYFRDKNILIDQTTNRFSLRWQTSAFLMMWQIFADKLVSLKCCDLKVVFLMFWWLYFNYFQFTQTCNVKYVIVTLTHIGPFRRLAHINSIVVEKRLCVLFDTSLWKNNDISKLILWTKENRDTFDELLYFAQSRTKQQSWPVN